MINTFPMRIGNKEFHVIYNTFDENDILIFSPCSEDERKIILEKLKKYMQIKKK